MFKSIKSSTKLLLLGAVLVTFIVMDLVITSSVTGDFKFVFNAPIVLSIGVLLLCALVVSGIYSNKIIFPLKRVEKTMKNIKDGKTVDNRMLKDITNISEIKGLVANYTDIMQGLAKNSFEVNSVESKTAVIIERMEDGVIAFSMQKEIIQINTAARQLAKLTNEDNSFEKVMKKLKLRIDFDKVLYMTGYNNIVEKTTIDDNVLDVMLVPFQNERLMPMGVIVIIKNITESEKLNNMRKEFVANVSHELKTPLCSIKGYSETIMDRDLAKEDTLRFAKVINDEANRMDRIVQDLLQLSRFDYRKNVLNKVKLNIDDLAKQVVENMQYLAKEKNHNLKCIVNMVPGPVYADKDGLQQVMTNIISNSVKYTPDGGEITVYIGAAGGKAYVKFVDNGMGIPDKDLRRIFERFYRVDKARSRQMGGTGLGLSIVKEIVEAHEGTIDIKSEVGIGTEVIVTIPIMK